ncbi:uncharacterized protein LOC111021710 [Momordica charantia]|uniref:Uncharacterized protein LOC111021710 n=1 Tax=Momordica charantia TaxID=3673 RepID=A0A6J1DM36_MOMCH|nr:uncharacterized protein LOC111021710 [Momordica charantia]
MEYLDDIEKEHWARCFQTELRYTQMTTNVAESVNAFFRHTPKLPVTALLDHIREKMFAEYSDSTMRHIVVNIDQFHFEVRDGNLDGIVDLNSRTCSCREFDYFRIPRLHVIAGAMVRNINLYTLCDEAYTTNFLILAYTESIFPVRHV